MPTLKELDATVTLADQMDTTDSPIVLVNLFEVQPEDEKALRDAWPQDAALMQVQPGYISTQLHKGIAGSGTWMNHAIWQDVDSFRKAFTNPAFQSRLAA
ncbi:antibiotic biosynthesis monooxygenase [Rhodobacteraceae bacterium]|nr:antibiotic biosynthesis monooxygenase [Paracoccaceae bacterium]